MRPVLVDNPPNPWVSREVDYLGEAPRVLPGVYFDHSKSIVAKNDSPDLGFRYSVNPYRGCLHGCAYCYARPSHEYLGFGSGSDFESKIVVKPRAAELLREALQKPNWSRELLLFSGNTDCYQPLEAHYRLTRRCLEVCLEFGNPVHVISKAALVERDLDLFVALSGTAGFGVSISIPFFRAEHARAIEPYAPTPARRFKVVERLSQAGLHVTVNVAPLIPGLGEREMVQVLEAAANAGARSAALIVLRLPGNVGDVFSGRLRRELPLAADRVLARTREMRGGRLNDPRFGARMRGSGRYADVVQELFRTTARRLGLSLGIHTPRSVRPRAVERANPSKRGSQLSLFTGSSFTRASRP